MDNARRPLPFAFILRCPFCSDFEAQSTASGQHHAVDLTVVCGRTTCRNQQSELDAEIQQRYAAWKRADGCNVEWCE